MILILALEVLMLAILGFNYRRLYRRALERQKQYQELATQWEAAATKWRSAATRWEKIALSLVQPVSREPTS